MVPFPMTLGGFFTPGVNHATLDAFAKFEEHSFIHSRNIERVRNLQTDRYRASFPQAKYYLPRPLRGLAANICWWRYFVVKARIYMVSLLDFIKSISWKDDTQDVNAQIIGEKMDPLTPGEGRPGPARPGPSDRWGPHLATGLGSM